MARTRKAEIQAAPSIESNAASRPSKHRRVFDHLLAGIQSGELKPGDRLPSEAELGKQFGASRITVAKAVNDLQRMGLVSRRPGAGTHVLDEKKLSGRTFGLLVPESETDIFEPISSAIMHARFAPQDALLWGKFPASERDGANAAEETVQSFLSQRVSGVFFAPLEVAAEKDTTNRRIARALERAQIPFVLLGHCYMRFPERSQHDLVGIDNRRAGYISTAHLLSLGVRRLVYLSDAVMGNVTEARITGFYEALRRHRVEPERKALWRGDPQQQDFVREMLSASRPEGVICGDDLTAARLMQTLLTLAIRIPEDVRIVGIGDVSYAGLLPVPLTTIRQDCSGIGAVAMATMRERLDHPDLPARDVLVPVRLVVRRSCGAHLAQNPTAAEGAAGDQTLSGD